MIPFEKLLFVMTRNVDTFSMQIVSLIVNLDLEATQRVCRSNVFSALADVLFLWDEKISGFFPIFCLDLSVGFADRDPRIKQQLRQSNGNLERTRACAKGERKRRDQRGEKKNQY